MKTADIDKPITLVKLASPHCGVQQKPLLQQQVGKYQQGCQRHAHDHYFELLVHEQTPRTHLGKIEDGTIFCSYQHACNANKECPANRRLPCCQR